MHQLKRNAAIWIRWLLKKSKFLMEYDFSFWRKDKGISHFYVFIILEETIDFLFLSLNFFLNLGEYFLQISGGMEKAINQNKNIPSKSLAMILFLFAKNSR